MIIPALVPSDLPPVPRGLAGYAEAEPFAGLLAGLLPPDPGALMVEAGAVPDSAEPALLDEAEAELERETETEATLPLQAEQQLALLMTDPLPLPDVRVLDGMAGVPPAPALPPDVAVPELAAVQPTPPDPGSARTSGADGGFMAAAAGFDTARSPADAQDRLTPAPSPVELHDAAAARPKEVAAADQMMADHGRAAGEGIAARDAGPAPVQPVVPGAVPAPALEATGARDAALPVLTRHLAGQLAAALPRLRSVDGEAVLTLDPARLGQVTLRWMHDGSATSVLTVQAANPATSALLSRLQDEMTQLVRVDPAIGTAASEALRVEIVRAERPAEPRHPDSRSQEAGQHQPGRDAGGDSGWRREPERGWARSEERTQGRGRATVNQNEPADMVTAGPATVRADGRLA